MNYTQLKNFIYNYKTVYPQGFTFDEIKDVLTHFPSVNIEKYNNAMTCLTCFAIDGNTVIFHCDVLTGIRCGLENRDISPLEFD